MLKILINRGVLLKFFGCFFFLFCCFLVKFVEVISIIVGDLNFGKDVISGEFFIEMEFVVICVIFESLISEF